MEEILKFENRDKLYHFLIEDYNMIKIDEKYDSKNFGNFYIILSSKEFSLSYINDRSFLDIYIESNFDPKNGFPLSFIKNYIYHPNHLMDDEGLDNESRIENLNNFLKNEFDKLRELFNEDNYFNTRKIIDKLLREQFIKKFPHAIK